VIGALLLLAQAASFDSALSGLPQDRDPEGVAHFESRIRPVLVEKCYRCHSETAEKLKGDLRLDSRAGVLRGGNSGPAIVPGKPEESLLFKAIRHADPELKMPPKEKLDDRTAADFEAWIRRGAPDPRAGPVRKTEKPLWSLQPIRELAPPAVKNESWVRTPIDRFILAKLEEKGLAPAPEADRRTLLRRLSFDLTGLPPDGDPAETYEAAVDRLLASPHYGERWGRHWLDAVHFGETHGYDKDKKRPNAWPYRDYVIRAFNEDRPYSRFAQEQLAGDVLWPGDSDGVVATGFIAAGPWDFVGHVELPETKTDGLIARYNDRDDMLSTAMSTFLSLTVHCARCHDHKFDPIPQSDYYALQAVFAGVDRADRPYDVDPAVAARRRSLEADRRALEAKLPPDALKDPAAPRESPSNGWHSAIEGSPDVEKWVEVDLGREVAIDEIRLVPARPTDFRDTPGFGFPARFRVDAGGVVLDATTEDHPNPGAKPVVIPGRKARVVRVTATRLWKRAGDWVFALAEIEVMSGGKNVAAGATVRSLDSIEAGRWSRKYLVDGFDSRSSRADRKALEAEREALVASRLDAVGRARLDEARRELAALPKPSLVYAPVPRAPRTIHVLSRGDVKRPLRVAEPGALSCVPGPAFRLDTPADEGQRRAALARWIGDPRNDLARRSIVNRVWHHHFGRGLVETPNDFGRMGAEPSHPELLDWLARWFPENGESLKGLHRLIATSAVYRQSSRPSPEAASLDPDNRLLSRMPRQRLDAESFRDALLAASGRLERRMGGPSDEQFLFKDDHSPVYDYARFDVEGPAARRRSVYRLSVRSVPDPFFDALDGADPSILTPRRNTTLTVNQALVALNDPFVLSQCRHLAARAGTVEEAFRLALGRAPSPDEAAAMKGLAERHGLASVCRVLVNSNEFMFVD
jgi:hypothetical protein